MPETRIQGLAIDSCWFGRVLYPPGSTLGPRIQRDIQLVLVETGEADVTLDGTRHRVAAGRVCALAPGGHEHFQFARNRETQHSWCSARLVSAPDGWVDRLAAGPFDVPVSRALQRVIDLGIDLLSQQAPLGGHVELRRHLALAAFQAYLAAAEGVGSDARPLPPAVERAAAYVVAHFHEPLTADDLARAAHLSTSQLTRAFKQHLGQTPMRYAWMHRTRRGVDLLRNTGLTVSQIAERVGFSSPYHFSRLVRAHFGQSPRELRNASWEAR